MGLGDELFSCSHDRDINTVRLMEVTPAVFTVPAATKTPAKSLKTGLQRDRTQEMGHLGQKTIPRL